MTKSDDQQCKAKGDSRVQTGVRSANVIPIRRATPVHTGGGGVGREPSGADVITMLLGSAPESILRGLDLTEESSAEWASVIESNRSALESRERFGYAEIAGLALTYAFLKPAWNRASRSARDTVWQLAVPFDVLMQFGESLRCEIEDREAGVGEDQNRHYAAVVVALKADRDAARTERDALRAAESQGKRKRSQDARKGTDARWAGKAKAKYLPRMLAWLQAHPTPEQAKNACARYFHSIMEDEYGKDAAPAPTTVRAWLQGK